MFAYSQKKKKKKENKVYHVGSSYASNEPTARLMRHHILHQNKIKTNTLLIDLLLPSTMNNGIGRTGINSEYALLNGDLRKKYSIKCEQQTNDSVPE